MMALTSYGTTLDELLPNERNTVEIFQKFSPKVVYVHRLATVVNHSYERMQVNAGAGSGIIWDAQGHIVTNFHVINGADNLTVSIGKLTVPAKVVGAEPRKDIAVLAIKSPKALELLKSFTPFELTHTNELLVGQKTIAIGNPFGLDHSLTVGVISALGRQVPGAGGVTIRDMIQTDTSINPGNSGGPLLDSKGRLIGLNTAIYSNSGSSAGVGFAVPADDIARIVPQIIKNGRVMLSGIGIQVVEPHIARRLGIEKGLLVADVLPHTPAAQAKLHGTVRDSWGRIHIGDVITAINGHPVKNYDNFYNILVDIKVGETINLSVLRQGKILNYKLRTIDIAAY
ncbi:trypsin-like peptidase domain-containing protein [Legionella cardiaca]|uniref:Trypsin-like peptidase domain-containing protein n=2 Tax=Legionella cardiaca TaxID=1071983 RepID=A0ABY8AVY3_9GAMM|nr:trypsin-like peptidase domain-containing protein [Legionella cardiaca]WED44638.1 trypsin-like peptidase domain-containing protein [Legionella cardiaca]